MKARSLSFSLTIMTSVLLQHSSAADTGLSWQVEYDDANRVAAQIDPAGRRTEFTYEAAANGPVAAVTKTPPEGAPTIWRFEKNGRLAAMTDTEGTVSYRYDDMGRLAAVERAGAPAITYAYDALDRVAEMRIGDFYRLGYTYDFLGRIEKIATPAGEISYEYLTGQGTVVRKLPNGVRTFWKRQLNGELESITHGFFKKPGDPSYSVLLDFTYRHGPDGRIAEIAERSGRGASTQRYAYDPMGRLTGVATSGSVACAFEYDALGNRTRATAAGRAGQTCSYDWAGRLTSVAGAPCSLDAAGNLTGLTLAGATSKFSFNTAGQIAEATRGTSRITYRYDGDGRLLLRQSTKGETRFVPDPLSTFWQPLVIEEGGKRTLVVWDGATPLALVRDGKPEFLLTDHLGSVRAITNAKGDVVRSCTYDPFGTPEEAAAGPSLAPGFTGLFRDAETGLYLTLARAYAPEFGQFLQPDPVKRVPLGANTHESLYAYCGGDPANLVDRAGRSPDRVFEGLSAANGLLASLGTAARQTKQYWAGVSESAINSGSPNWVASGLRATLADVLGGTIPGEGGNAGQSIASFGWGLVGAAPGGAATAFGVVTTGVSSVVASAQGDLASAGWSLLGLGGAYAAQAATRLAQIPVLEGRGLQYQMPLFTSTSDFIQGRAALDAEAAIGSLNTASSIIGLGGHVVDFFTTDWQPAVNAIPQASQLAWQGFRQAASNFTSSHLGTPSPVGGVYLGGAGAALDGLGMLAGVAVDANGQLVLLGSGPGDAIKLPPLRIDDVVTVFRSVYLDGEGPTVTIDPNPENPRGPTMIIRHSEATANTYVGWILFEADRLMKGYTLGQDNVTQQPIVTRVPGYAELQDTIFFGDTNLKKWQQGGNWERFWIVPAGARRFEGPRRELTLLDVPLKVNTQKMKWKGAELVDDPTGRSSPGATQFVDWFTRNYEPIAAEQFLTPPPEAGLTGPVPVFSELRRIALITAIAEKLRDQGVPLPFWMRDHAVTPVPFGDTTPSLTVPRQKAIKGGTLTAQIFGGVNLSPETAAVQTIASGDDVKKLKREERPAAEQGLRLAAALEQAVATAPALAVAPPLQIDRIAPQGGRELAATVLPGSESLALGPCRLEEPDLVVPVADGRTIELRRSYNSFFDPVGPWGRGWALDLPRLQKTRIPVTRERSHVVTRPVFELLTPLNRVYARFQNARPVAELGGNELPVPDRDGPFLALAQDKPAFLSGVTTKAVFLKDGRTWHFTSGGDLVAIEDGGLATVYERDGSGRLKRIVGMRGGAIEAEIALEYSAAGSLAQATGQTIGQPGSRGSVPLEISYRYDGDGRLAGVVSTSGTVDYRYAGPWVADISWQPAGGSGSEGKPSMLRAFEYDRQGRLVAERRGDSNQIQHHFAADAGGFVATAVDAADATQMTTTRFDTRMRPVEARDPDGTVTRWAYSETGGTVATVDTGDGETLSITESADRRTRTLETPGRPKLASEVDAAGRVVTLTRGDRPVLRQQWRRDGQLAQAESVGTTTSFDYDEQGLVTRTILEPTGAREKSKGKPTPWHETALDRWGNLVSVRDSRGLDVQMRYDATGALASMAQTTPEGNLGYNIERDAEGRINAVKSSWGEETYHYDQDGRLQRIATTRGDQTATVEFAGGLVQRIRQFDGAETAVTYRPADSLPATITCANGTKLAFSYDDTARLAGVTVGEQREVALGYDGRGRVVEYAWKPAMN